MPVEPKDRASCLAPSGRDLRRARNTVKRFEAGRMGKLPVAVERYQRAVAMLMAVQLRKD